MKVSKRYRVVLARLKFQSALFSVILLAAFSVHGDSKPNIERARTFPEMVFQADPVGTFFGTQVK